MWLMLWVNQTVPLQITCPLPKCSLFETHILTFPINIFALLKTPNRMFAPYHRAFAAAVFTAWDVLCTMAYFFISFWTSSEEHSITYEVSISISLYPALFFFIIVKLGFYPLSLFCLQCSGNNTEESMGRMRFMFSYNQSFG